MEQKNFFHTFIKAVCGKKYVMMLTDTAQIMAKQQQLQKSPGFNEIFTKISQSIRNHVISGGALAIGLSLSLQRYFPTQFSTFGLIKVIADLALISICLLIATNYSLKLNQVELSKIKKRLILDYDKTFLNHMAQIQIKYDIQEQDQVRGILNQQQYKQWLQKRHQYIY